MKLEMHNNLQPLQNLSAKCARFTQQGLQNATLSAGNAVKSWIDANFASQGNLAPGGWPAPKNQTVVNARFMEKSGRLRRNWTITADATSVTVKAGASYALAHHTGTNTLPARPLIPQNQTLQNLVLPVYLKALTNHLP